MKFLSKSNSSSILEEELSYIPGSDNSYLKFKLLAEQKNFCAYTEKYVTHGMDSIDVEHFDPSKKNNDDYFNYYAVLRSANERKIRKYRIYANSPFFVSLFFQNQEEFDSRIRYNDFVYETVNENDEDAKNLIDFLGFNDDYLYTERIYHIKRLQETLAAFSEEQKIEYFRTYKRDLSYVTAIEKAFNIDLSEIINS